MTAKRLAFIVAVLLAGTTVVRAAEEAVKTFNIPAKPLAQALADFSRQSDVIIIAPSDLTLGKTSQAVAGSMSPSKALDQLLSGTSLRYAMEKDGSVIVQPRQQGAQALPALSAGSRLVLVRNETAPADVRSDSEGRGEMTAATESKKGSELVVTGSRLRAADRTASIVTIDRETIEKRGFSTAEDIIRSLPQNLSNMNSTRNVTQPVGGDELPVGIAAQGEIMANLRGIGQGATLVLIDGRRTSGSAAFSGEAVNLSTIPVASIERIEVMSDSAAAVYGSDAIAGVINIVLRKDYRGASSSLRFEDGENGGDKRAFDQIVGFGWGRGSLTATLSLSDVTPVRTADTGYTTNDLRSLGGVDYRNTIFGQPGNARNDGGSLPLDFDGTEAWTLADLTQNNFQAARAELIRPQQSSANESRSIYIRAEQSLSDRIEGFASLRYSEQDLKVTLQAPIASGTVSAASPYNPTGQALLMYYAATHEYSSGLLPMAYALNDLTGLAVDAGLRIDLPLRDWRMDVSAMYSVSAGKTSAMEYNSTGLRSRIATEINPFGNGTAQNIDAFVAEFRPATNIHDRTTTLRGLTVLAEGSAADLPAGSVRTVVGAEYRVEGLSYGPTDFLGNRDLADLSPSQSVAALFTEASLPLFSGASQSLAATLQARWERYEMDTTLAVSDGKTFDELSPRVGLIWNLNPQLALRGSWGHAFKAPNIKHLVSAPSLGTFPSNQYDAIQDEIVPVFIDSIPNPDLKPETGESITLGVDWNPARLPGTAFALTYNRTDVTDQIIGSIFVVDGVSLQDFIARPDLFPTVSVRDPVTNTLLRIQGSAINVAAVEVEAVDFSARFTRSLPLGNFSAGLQGTYKIRHDQQVAALLEPRGLQGTTSADRLRATVSFSWSGEQWGLDLYGNHTGGYWNTEVLEINAVGAMAMRVRARTTWDLSAYREFGAGWRVSAGARNLFDDPFPFHQGFAGPFDTRRVDLRGRLLQMELRKEFSF